jgi:eukaryotic-like serine/threonine-protein kinase
VAEGPRIIAQADGRGIRTPDLGRVAKVQVKDLSAEQFGRLSDLLDQAFEIPPQRRQAWLADLRAHDPELSVLVADIVASDSVASAEQLIETRDMLHRQFAAAIETRQSLIGKQFGPYRIIRRLGQGGMGSVWLAERVDGLFTRQVALKLVHTSLLGSTLIERFARERTILAALNHPRIARLFDAGVSDDGQPYLALEYVEGVPLTEYCNRHRLDIPARIELFQQVLSAVQYAHTNLVIHRDLKPSNILVTKDGDVMLLDFGIAKLTTDGEAKETQLTEVGGRAFTPEYASPEQVSGMPVTTASDVYALGVVLYELLCGQRPYALKRTSLGALEDAILMGERAKPSQMVVSDEVAAERTTTPKRLRQMLAGDLDTIALKALKKQAGDRYGSANAMMQDLERFRRGEAVLARPDSSAYRFRKFVSRNKLAVGGVAATGLALALGLAAALWEASVARDRAIVAHNEAVRATAVQDFLLDLFRANSVEQPDPIKARQTTARELLDLGSKQVDQGLGAAPEARAAVLGTLADMYYQLGMNAEAASNRMREVAALKEAYGPKDPRVASELLSYAADIADLPERSQAAAALEEARQILDSAHDNSSETRGKLLVMLAQANRYTAIDKMRMYADQAVAFFRQRYPHSSNLSLSLAFAGSARLQQGDAEGAEAAFHQALTEVASNEGEKSAWAVFPLIGLAEAQDALGKVEDAERSYRSAFEVAKASFGDYHPETLLAEAKLGAYLQSTGRPVEGNRWMETAVAGVGKGKGGYTPPYVAAVLAGMRARALLADGRLEEAAPLMAVDVNDARENYPGSAPLANALRSQIALDVALGHYEEATRQMDEALHIAQGIGTAGSTISRNRLLLDQSRLLLAQGEAQPAIETLHTVAPPAYASKLPLDVQEVAAKTLLADAHLQQQKVQMAMSAAQDALGQVTASTLRNYYPVLEANAALQLGEAQHASGDLQDSRVNLERAVGLREANGDIAQNPWLAQAQIALADCLIDLGDRAAAGALVKKAAAIQATHPELGEHFKAPLNRVAGRLSAR